MTAASAVLRVCRLRPDRDGDVPLPRAMSAEAAGLDVCPWSSDRAIGPRCLRGSPSPYRPAGRCRFAPAPGSRSATA